MKKHLLAAGSAMMIGLCAGASQIDELKAKIPGIFAKSAAHYKALDAAATPLMKNERGDVMVPQGFKRDKRVLDMRNKEWWTSGHYPGSLWYLYEATGDAFFKDRATVWTENLIPISKFTGNHDIGFMMFCSFGNARRILKTDRYDHLLVEAAGTLCLRFEPKLGVIRSWGKVDDRKNFLVIPDNMMNLELLEWAAKAKNGEKRFADVARSHADVTMKNHFRADGGTYHVLNYDQKTLRVKAILRGQGASCETAWSRGMARVEPKPNHRNSDVHLVVLAEKSDSDAAPFLKKLRRYESYHHTFWGWSHYRVIALETSTGRLTCNRMGQILTKLFRNIKSAIEKESNEK